MAERFVTETIHDKTLDVSLRPGLFADFQGQGKVKERLELAAGFGKDHACLYPCQGDGREYRGHQRPGA
jgi:Holliday junction resolvasome RuvABC ATP-dependent DNA helicase subunit